jgi:hypothetical protein
MSGRRTAPQLVPGLQELLTAQAGLARRSQLAGLGVTADHIARHIAAGRWRQVGPEVISVDNGRLDLEQRRWRAALHGPCGWIGGRSALESRGLRGYEPSVVHLLVPIENRPATLEGVRLHVTSRRPDTASESTGGLPVCSSPRATVDAAAWDPFPRAAAGLVLAVVQQRLATPDDIAAELAVAGRVRHRAVVRQALIDAGAGADSLAEADVVPLLRRAGLPVPRRQSVRAGRRRDLEVDLPDGRVLVIEVDGAPHNTPEARWVDAERDAELAAEGILGIRIPAFAIRHDPARVVARLRRIYEAAVARAVAAQAS